MNCPHCGISIDEHKASHCMDLWVMQDVFGWTKSESSYEGDFYPEGSYFVTWHQPDDFMPGKCLLISQAFDKDGKNLRSTEDNPVGVWDESPGYNYSLRFSTDIAAAWEVVETLKLCIWPTEQGNWFVHNTKIDEVRGEEWWFHSPLKDRETLRMNGTVASTVPLAICRAALKASHD